MQVTGFNQSSARRDGVILFALIVFLGLMEYVGWFNPLRAAVEKQLQPLLAFEVEAVRLVQRPARAFSRSFERAEHQVELEKRYTLALSELSELQYLRKENEALRALLENTNRTLGERRVAAPVVSLSYPAVSAGEEEGIIEGSMVTYQDTLLGVVREVSPHQSRVSLLVSRDSVPVLATTDSGVQGLIRGDGKRTLLTEVPREAALTVGEKVVTLGQQGIRRQVFIGTISRIDTRASAPTQTAVVEQLVSFYEAPIVEVW